MRKIFSNQLRVQPVNVFRQNPRIFKEDGLIYKEKRTSFFFKEGEQSLFFKCEDTKRQSPKKELVRF
jgi:hypothetical protein